MNTKQLGNIAIGKAIAYFSARGITVSIPLNDSQSYDLVIDMDGVLKKVQVKYTAQYSSASKPTFTVGLRSISGTTRKQYSGVTSLSCDILFVCCGNDLMYSIPSDKIVNVSAMHLTSDWDAYLVS